jgi:hypothetical protein
MRRFHSLLVVVVLTLVLTACGSTSTSRPANIPQPDIDASLLHEIFFASQNNAPASIEVRVTNRAAVPITVRKIEVDSPGMGQYTILRTSRLVREVIESGQTKAIGITATAVTTTSRPSEPLTLRAIVEFEAGGTHWREIMMAR